MTNAIRHGKASTVRVDLFEKRGPRGAGGGPKPELQLLIQDDGRGILPNTPLGFGLTAMRERLHALGGTCAIQSTQTRGAILSAVIPITVAAAAQARPPEHVERIEAS